MPHDAAPAVSVTLGRQDVARALRGALLALQVLVLGAWVGQAAWVGDAWVGRLGVALAALAGAAWALHGCVPRQAWQLAWTGRAWQWQVPGASAAEGGRVDVALDLGGWMLVRLQDAATGRVQWLPVQRRGLEAAWPVLRCAVRQAPARTLAVANRPGAAP